MFATAMPITFRKKVNFLKHHAKYLAVWPLLCILVIASIWYWGLNTIDRERADIRKNAYSMASAQARTYAEQVERTVGQLDYIVRGLKFSWQKNGGKLNLEEHVAAGLVPESASISVTILDRTGVPVTTTIPTPYRRQSVASLEHFQFHQKNTSQALHISKPTANLLTDRDIVLLSRRLEDDSGAFAGVIALAIEPMFLGSFVDATKLSPDDFVSIRRSDGAFLLQNEGMAFRPISPFSRAGTSSTDRVACGTFLPIIMPMARLGLLRGTPRPVIRSSCWSAHPMQHCRQRISRAIERYGRA